MVREGFSRTKAALLVLILAIVASLTVAPSAAHAEETTMEEPSPEVAPFPARRVLTLIRFAPGVSITPGQDEVNEASEVGRFDCDVSIALRINLTQGRAWLSLMPDFGYTYHNGDVVGGHYGTLGFGLRYGTDWIAVNPMATLLLGERSDQFDLGVRAGLRLLAALDLVGLEVAYEYRTLGDDGVDLHGLRIAVIFDIGVVFMPTLLTRFGYSFGRSS